MRTGKVIKNFGRVRYTVSPADFAVLLWAGEAEENTGDDTGSSDVLTSLSTKHYIVFENEEGVFAGAITNPFSDEIIRNPDNLLIHGTGKKVSIPLFSDCKYPALLKTLWFDLQFGDMLNAASGFSILPNGQFPSVPRFKNGVIHEIDNKKNRKRGVFFPFLEYSSFLWNEYFQNDSVSIKITYQEHIQQTYDYFRCLQRF